MVAADDVAAVDDDTNPRQQQVADIPAAAENAISLFEATICWPLLNLTLRLTGYDNNKCPQTRKSIFGVLTRLLAHHLLIAWL